MAAWTIGSCTAAKLLGYWLHRLLHSGGDPISQPQSYEASLCSLWAAIHGYELFHWILSVDRLFGTLKLQQPPLTTAAYAVAKEKFNYLEKQRDRAAWPNTNEDTRTTDNDAVLGEGTQDIP
jgi:hypothetical protein